MCVPAQRVSVSDFMDLTKHAKVLLSTYILLRQEGDRVLEAFDELGTPLTVEIQSHRAFAELPPPEEGVKDEGAFMMRQYPLFPYLGTLCDTCCVCASEAPPGHLLRSRVKDVGNEDTFGGVDPASRLTNDAPSEGGAGPPVTIPTQTSNQWIAHLMKMPEDMVTGNTSDLQALLDGTYSDAVSDAALLESEK